MLRRVTLGLAVCAAAWAQPAPTREGGYWVRRVTGQEELPASARLRITSRGPVTVSGAQQKTMDYTFTMRVKADTAEEATRLFREFGVHFARRNDEATLTMRRGAGSGELNVKVSQSLPEVAIVSTEGEIAVRHLDGAVDAATGGGAIRADRIGGAFTARTGGGEISLDNMGGAAHCQTGGGRITAGMVAGDVRFETGGGDIIARHVGGIARVSTGGGSIRIERAGHEVIAATGGGTIDVGEAGGTVTTRNSGGPVQVGSASGVRCENGAGGIRLQNVSGSLRVSTAFGNIVAQLLPGRPLADSSLTTANGDITVLIPSNVGVMIQAHNASADSIRRIVSEFPNLEVRIAGSQVVAEGPVNGGGPVLRISGTGGTIFIKRR